MPSERKERRRGAEWDLGVFRVAHRLWSSALGHLGLSMPDLESRSCSQQLDLSGSFVCTVDYPWPESKDTEVVLLTQQRHSGAQLSLFWG